MFYRDVAYIYFSKQTDVSSVLSLMSKPPDPRPIKWLMPSSAVNNLKGQCMGWKGKIQLHFLLMPFMAPLIFDFQLNCFFLHSKLQVTDQIRTHHCFSTAATKKHDQFLWCEGGVGIIFHILLVVELLILMPFHLGNDDDIIKLWPSSKRYDNFYFSSIFLTIHYHDWYHFLQPTNIPHIAPSDHEMK